MVNSNDLATKLNNLGLSENQANVYLSLLKQGILSPLELSRITQINRTTIYRLLDELNKIGITEEVLDQKRVKAKAVEPEKLELLVDREEAKVKKLKGQLPKLISQLGQIKDIPSSSTKVLYFRGQKGLQQMLWNVTKTKGEFLGYGYGNWNDSVGKEFAEKLRQKIVDKKIISREIQNEDQVNKVKTYSDTDQYDKYHESRSILKSVVEINHDTYVYDGVFAFYHFFEGELFGVEIHNKEIAKTQRQIFEVLWKQAKKI